MAIETYHVNVEGRRTSVTLDVITAKYLALALGVELGSGHERRILQDFIQRELDELGREPAEGLANWLRERALMEIAKPDVLTNAKLLAMWS